MSPRLTPDAPAERLADRLLRLYGLHPPVDVRSIIEQVADVVEIDVPSDIDADAIAVIGSDAAHRSTVLLNKRRPASRQRFTLAHELAHIMIPWHLGSIACAVGSSLEHSLEEYASFEREANAFASWFLLPRTWLAEVVVSDRADVADMLDRLEIAEVSAEAGLLALKDVLPRGYVLALLDNANRIERAVRSSGTLPNPPERKASIKSVAYLATVAESHGISTHRGRRIAWWRFPDHLSIEAPAFKSRAALERELKEVERALLERAGLSTKRQSFAGVVGFANGSSGSDLEEIAAAIVQRISTRDEFIPVFDEPDFDRWLQLKSALFSTRPAQRRNRQ